MTQWSSGDSLNSYNLNTRGPVPALNIVAFGAVAGADSGDAIESAMSQAGANGGGSVFVPEGTFLASRITMRPYVSLVGTGWASILKQKSSSNTDFIRLRDVDTDATYIGHLQIDGNRGNQTQGSAIYYDNTGGDFAISSVPRHRMEDLLIWNVKQDGLNISSSAGAVGTSVFDNIQIYVCDRYGVYINTVDLFFSNVDVGQSGEAGWQIEKANAHLDNCNAWFSGRLVQSTGDGFFINANRVQLTGCQAQDNGRHGFAIYNCAAVKLTGCVADSNATQSGASTVASGFALDHADSCYVTGVAVDRHTPASQNHPLRVSQGGTGILSTRSNYVNILAYSNLSDAPNITSTLTNNDITVNRINYTSNAQFRSGGVVGWQTYSGTTLASLYQNGVFQVSGKTLGIATNAGAPAGNSAGTTGDIMWGTNSGASFIYVCTSANSWMRAALSPF